MKKTLIAALIVTAGMGGQIFAQGTVSAAGGPNYDGYDFGPLGDSIVKVGVLNLSLNNTFQAYNKGSTWGVTTTPNRGVAARGGFQPWDNFSYEAIYQCVDQPTKYASSSKAVNNKSVISSINAAFAGGGLYTLGKIKQGLFSTQGPTINRNPYYGQSFTANAKIVVVNHENTLRVPPYPPTESSFVAGPFKVPPYSPGGTQVPNAPYYLNGAPFGGLLALAGTPANEGEYLPLSWPNQNYIAWGKPLSGLDFFGFPFTNWIGAQVYIIDPNNKSAYLQCFDVTPFFEISEASCQFCWDTMDRVTDGSIQGTTTLPPCSPASGCGQKGKGVTKWYWTLKFNSVGGGWPSPNVLLDLYYGWIIQVDPDWYVIPPDVAAGGPLFNLNPSDNGTRLDDTDVAASKDSLVFTVSGIANYPWTLTQLSSASSAAIGTMSMSSQGHGYSPMCGVFSGAVSLTETDKASKTFYNSVSKTSVICF